MKRKKERKKDLIWIKEKKEKGISKKGKILKMIGKKERNKERNKETKKELCIWFWSIWIFVKSPFF